MSFFLRIQKKIQQLSLLGYGNTTCFCLFCVFPLHFFSSKSHLNLYKIRSGEKCSTEKKRRWRKIRVETHCKLTTQRHPIQRLPRPPLHTHIHMRTFVLVKKISTFQKLHTMPSESRDGQWFCLWLDACTEARAPWRRWRKKRGENSGKGKCSPHTGRHATLCSALDNETPMVAATLVAICCVTRSHLATSLLMRR